MATHARRNGTVSLQEPLRRSLDHLAGAPLKSMKATVPTGVENSYFS